MSVACLPDPPSRHVSCPACSPPLWRSSPPAAKALADRDEAAPPAALQRAALDEGVASCATPRPDTSPFVVVVQLQADGAIDASWRNGSTPLALCLERFLRQRPLQVPPQAPPYLSICPTNCRSRSDARWDEPAQMRFSLI